MSGDIQRRFNLWMKPPLPPPNWGNDELSRFLDKARENTFANFNNLEADYKKLTSIDSLFEDVVSNLSHTSFSALFVFQSHSAYRAALSLLLGGQVAESYACMRLTLENALYAFYMFKNPDSLKTWMRRHENENAKKAVTKEFRIRGEPRNGSKSMLATLGECDKKLGLVAEILYEHTINFGAHPNQYGLKQRLNTTKVDDQIKIEMAYLIRGDSPASKYALECAANIGMGVLAIFRLIYLERFNIIGVSEKMELLKRQYFPS